MSEDELKAMLDDADEGPREVASDRNVRALVAEVRRYRAQVMDLKARAMDVRAFWRRHPGNHVVRQGISEQGAALLARIEVLT